jgi:hypothetical protein
MAPRLCQGVAMQRIRQCITCFCLYPDHQSAVAGFGACHGVCTGAGHKEQNSENLDIQLFAANICLEHPGKRDQAKVRLQKMSSQYEFNRDQLKLFNDLLGEIKRRNDLRIFAFLSIEIEELAVYHRID